MSAHLTDDGLFAQWIPMYQLDDTSLRIVIRTFCAVFGEVHSFLGIYNVQNPALVLVGRDPERASGPLQIDLRALVERLRQPVYGELLMTDYILPFEVISLLLLAALVGAAYIARMGGEEGGATDG